MVPQDFSQWDEWTSMESMDSNEYGLESRDARLELGYRSLSIQTCKANSFIIPIRCIERREAVVQRRKVPRRIQERIVMEGEINNHSS